MTLTRKIGTLVGSVVALAGLVAYSADLYKGNSDWETLKSQGEAYSYTQRLTKTKTHMDVTPSFPFHQVILLDQDNDGNYEKIEERKMFGPIGKALVGVDVRNSYNPNDPRFNQILEDVEQGKASKL